VPELRCQADVVFPGERIAVFIDGCFWHGCPLHGRTPASNSSYWADKMARNKARDERNTAVLTEKNWLPLRYWEHEEPSTVAEDIGSHVIRRRNRG
jgi:DNA mismatch endonuclease (patch repair protein)